MSKQDKKIVQERIKVDAYGDERIEKAKGKCSRQKWWMCLIDWSGVCCLGQLEEMRGLTEQRIIKIKTETEELDKNRRTLEEKNKKERANKIQNEVIQSHKKNVEIDWNWQELEEKEDCKELAEVRTANLINEVIDNQCFFSCNAFKQLYSIVVNRDLTRLNSSGHWSPKSCLCQDHQWQTRADQGVRRLDRSER